MHSNRSKFAIVFYPIMALLAGCKAESMESEVSAAAAIPVRVYHLSQPSKVRAFEYYGFATASRKARVVAKVSGLIEYKHANEGMLVGENELLFSIEQAPYKFSLEQQKYELQKAEIELANVARELERSESLKKINSISDSQLDELKTRRSSAEADVALLRTTVAKARYEFDSTQVRAPISGRVLFATANVGGFVKAGESELVEIINDDIIYVDFPIPETDYSRFFSSSADDHESSIVVSVRTETGETADAILNWGGRNVDRSSGTLLARAEVRNEKKVLRDGMYVSVQIESQVDDEYYLVPKRSVFFSASESFIYVAADVGTAKKKVVNIVDDVDGRYLVSSGLEPGDKIIIDNLAHMKDGLQVKVSL